MISMNFIFTSKTYQTLTLYPIHIKLSNYEVTCIFWVSQHVYNKLISAWWCWYYDYESDVDFDAYSKNVTYFAFIETLHLHAIFLYCNELTNKTLPFIYNCHQLTQNADMHSWSRCEKVGGRFCHVFEGHHKSCVTPYMHVFAYHVPDQIREHGNIRQFGQGMII